MLFFLAALLGLLGVALWLFDVQRARGQRDVVSAEAPTPSAELGQEEIENPEDLASPPLPEQQPNPRKAPRFAGLPGSARRQKRQWAAQQGFAFSNGDELLSQEWERGPEGTAKNVVSGVVRGNEVRLFDIAGTTMMAARRSAFSEHLLWASREDGPPEELVRIANRGGFYIYGSDQGAVQRVLDQRAEEAFAGLPDAVQQVWCEADWVLATFIRGHQPEDWDRAAEALSLLADAAMVLPRRGNTDFGVEYEDLDPTRPLPPAPDAQELAPEEPTIAVPEVEEAPVVVELPSRSATIAKGAIEQRPLGGDEVEAIGTGHKPAPSDFQGTRVLRDLSKGSSIFEDIAREMGTDPLEKDAEDE
ncbi:hypothetical protein [Corynebacterium pelargi]|uniref:Uncharacterized protein n=1 Tax=Corynebacterium pelargi TaxID=1471400 RepID=A0A410W6A5_9CORY|nr:hypothetical protein [Corynebacterium pelargi]QAU51568.1 hypothetical protein CPELA_01340 [Corynebacterium pelargi]GGG82397.1 hypothetical protein GCM10007338_21640 [Corynebacterium pelargi]